MSRSGEQDNRRQLREVAEELQQIRAVVPVKKPFEEFDALCWGAGDVQLTAQKR